eukprot:COSAG01_NODE_2234_length_8097_cov_5.001500_6_plen_341_part_00
MTTTRPHALRLATEASAHTLSRPRLRTPAPPAAPARMPLAVAAMLTLLALGTAAFTPALASTCSTVEMSLCGNRTNPSECFVCIGDHVAVLSAAGCTQTDYNAFCKQPGPSPTPPTPPTPGPPPPDSNRTGCFLRPGRPAVYTPLCAAAKEAQCAGPFYEHTCYWSSPTPPTGSACQGWMEKSGCGDAPTEAACEMCMVGLSANTNVLQPSCTGTCYACAPTDFTSFCASSSSSRGNSSSGCQLRPGQPTIYQTLCASRTTESACQSELYEHTCYWASPPGPTDSSCLSGMAQACGHGQPQACEQCLVSWAISSGHVLVPHCTGTCYACKIADFTSFCHT